MFIELGKYEVKVTFGDGRVFKGDFGVVEGWKVWFSFIFFWG